MRCTATTTSGDPCPNWAIKGGNVCDQAHGGRAPQVKAKARERVLEAKARRLLPETLKVHPNPIQRVLELAAEIDEFRGIVLELVNGLDKWTTWSPETGLDVRAEIMVYERALERASRAYLDICRLNLEQRLVKIQEDVAGAMLAALERAMVVAGLSAEQQLDVRRETARALRAV